MASIKHLNPTSKPNNPAFDVSATAWDADHTTNVVANNRVIGRVSGANGPFEELTGSQLSALIGGTTGWPNTINIASFGATGNGSTDDTAAINAAYASLAGQHGLVLWPAGTYLVTDTINCGNATGGSGAAISFISTIGPAGLDGTTLKWMGPTDGRPAFRLAGNKYAIIKGLGIRNDVGSTGSSIGLQLGGRGSGDFGNSTLSIDIDQVRVTNFHVGIQDGNFGAASEITYRNLTLGNCDTGWVMNDFNSLNHSFFMLGMGNCGIGVDTGASTTGVGVFGVSTSSNTIADFKIQQNSTTTTIMYARFELLVSGARFILGNSGSCACTLIGCEESGAGPPERAIAGSFQSLTIRDCSFNSWIAPDKVSQITIQNTKCSVDGDTRLPMLFHATDSAATHCNFMNNYSGANSGSIDDFIGFVRETPYTNGVTPTPFVTAAIYPSYIKRFQDIPAANTGSPYGGDYTTLSMVRQLSEGPVPNSALPASRTLVTTAATLVGSGILTFASVPNTIRPFQKVTSDTNPGSFFVGTEVITTTATTVNVGGLQANVGLGDTIRFWPPGAATPGNNLRVSATFPTAATVSVLFTRSVTVNQTSRKLTITAGGRFYPTDVGKPVKLVGVAANGWTDVFGFISNYLNSTNIEFVGQLAEPTVPGSSGGVTTLIGQDEPDANYIVAGLCGDAGETFWVTGIGTTGFTLHSSNATSTANVVSMIVR